jgi:hypothetical protein
MIGPELERVGNMAVQGHRRRFMDDWTVYRVAGEASEKLAARA